MENIFVDTNIVIDLLAKREPFYKEAQDLFTLGDKNEVNLFISSLTLQTPIIQLLDITRKLMQKNTYQNLKFW